MIPETDRMKINDLQNKIKTMTDEKERIEKWVKDKELERDAFEEQMKVAREELIKLKAESDKEQAALKKEKEALLALKVEVNSKIEENKKIESEIDRKLSEESAKAAIARDKIVELEILELSVQAKLNRWTAIQSAFLAIK